MGDFSFDLQAAKNEALSADRFILQQEKIARFQAVMREEGLDGLICFKPQNTYFFSGFNPILYSHPVVVIIPARGKPALLLHALRWPHSKEEAAIKDIRAYAFWGAVQGIAADVYEAVRIVAQEKNITGGRIGYEGDFLPVGQYQRLLSVVRPGEAVDASQAIKTFQMIKNRYECNLMRLASWLTMMGMRAAIEHIRESEISASMAGEVAMREAWMRELSDFEVSGFGNTEGGIPTALWCYANSGYRVPYGCECPNSRIPRKGEVSLPIIWAAVEGQHAEMERTVVIEGLDPEHQNAYEAMLLARENAFRHIRPGVSVGEIFAAAYEAYQSHGLEAYTPARIGHGLGLSIHGDPSMNKDSTIRLREGMIFTVEPSFNFNGWGSLRHSDTVLVTMDGYENLTNDQVTGYQIVR